MMRLALATLLLAACGGPTASSPQSVFAGDDRQMLVDAAPWHAIGRVELHKTGVDPATDAPPFPYCTATLVRGDLVLTAAHCIIDTTTASLTTKRIWFRPDQRAGRTAKAVAVTYSWWGTTFPDDDRGNDWALLKLERDIGAEFGTIPVATDGDTLAFLSPVTLVGYSSDVAGGKSPSVHEGCRVRSLEFSTGLFLHDCDMNPGASGGPLLVKRGAAWSVVGVNVAEKGATGNSYFDRYTDAVANVAVPVSKPLRQMGSL